MAGIEFMSKTYNYTCLLIMILKFKNISQKYIYTYIGIISIQLVQQFFH